MVEQWRRLEPRPGLGRGCPKGVWTIEGPTEGCVQRGRLGALEENTLKCFFQVICRNESFLGWPWHCSWMPERLNYFF